MKNIGVIKISNQILEEKLFLPEGAKILGCRESTPQDIGVTFYIEGEGIPPRQEGEICPEVTLLCTRHKDKSLTTEFKPCKNSVKL